MTRGAARELKHERLRARGRELELQNLSLEGRVADERVVAGRGNRGEVGRLREKGEG